MVDEAIGSCAFSENNGPRHRARAAEEAHWGRKSSRGASHGILPIAMNETVGRSGGDEARRGTVGRDLVPQARGAEAD